MIDERVIGTETERLTLVPLREFDDFKILEESSPKLFVVNEIKTPRNRHGFVMNPDIIYVGDSIKRYYVPNTTEHILIGWYIDGAQKLYRDPLTERFKARDTTKYIIAINKANFIARDPHIDKGSWVLW